jgi:hypothetical protein
MAAEKTREPAVALFAERCRILLETNPKYRYKRQEPIFGLGDAVTTRGGEDNSYLRKVIGAGRRGIVMEVSDIPLISFDEEEYYLHQSKLKAEKPLKLRKINK